MKRMMIIMATATAATAWMMMMMMMIVTTATSAATNAATRRSMSSSFCNASSSSSSATAWIHPRDSLRRLQLGFQTTNRAAAANRAFSSSIGISFQRQRTFSSSSSIPSFRSSSTDATTEQKKTTTTFNNNNNDVIAPPSSKFIPYPFTYRQELEFRIETLTNRGWGIGRVLIPASPIVDTTPTSTGANTTFAIMQQQQQQQQQQRRKSSRQRRRRGKSQEKQDARDQEESDYIESLFFHDDDYGNNDINNEYSNQHNDNDNGSSSNSNNNNSSMQQQQQQQCLSSWVVMVPAVIPGELVTVRVYRNFKSYSHADLISVLEPSPHRVIPRCPLHTGCTTTATAITSSGTTNREGGGGSDDGDGGGGGDCGGCQLQHMTIDLQRYWKTRHVVEGLRQYGFAAVAGTATDATAVATSIPPMAATTTATVDGVGRTDKDNTDSSSLLVVSPCLGTNEIYGYRSKLTPHYDQPRSKSHRRRPGQQQQQQHGIGQDDDDDDDDDNVQTKIISKIGFQRQTMRQIVDVPNCPIATTAINVAYQELRRDLLSRRFETTTRTLSESNDDIIGNNNNDDGIDEYRDDDAIGGCRRLDNRKTIINNKKNQQRQAQPKQQQVIKGATLLLRQGNIEDKYVETDSRKFLTTTIRGFNFTYRAGNFFQNNYYILPVLVEHVIQAAVLRGGNGDRGGDGGALPQQGQDVQQQQQQGQQKQSTSLKYLVDCYCGSGLFAISAAPYMERVAGIEINERAIIEATANAMANNITNCDFKCATAEQIFESLLLHQPQNKSNSNTRLFDPKETVVILDPPRKGCSVDFLEQLQRYGPARIVYVSCDPTTQARDAVILVGKKPKQQRRQVPSSSSINNDSDDSCHAIYKITSIQPMDLFPQTRHIENVMVFERI